MAHLAVGQTVPKAVGDASDPASALAVHVSAEEAAQQAFAEAAAWAHDETAPAAALLVADAAVETAAAAAPGLASPDLDAVCVLQACDAAGVCWIQLLCHVQAHTHRMSCGLGHQQG